MVGIDRMMTLIVQVLRDQAKSEERRWCGVLRCVPVVFRRRRAVWGVSWNGTRALPFPRRPTGQFQESTCEDNEHFRKRERERRRRSRGPRKDEEEQCHELTTNRSVLNAKTHAPTIDISGVPFPRLVFLAKNL